MSDTSEDELARPITRRDLAKLTEAVETLARRFRRSMIVRAIIVSLALLALYGAWRSREAAHEANRGITAAQAAADRANQAIRSIQADRRLRRAETTKTIDKLEGEIHELACTIVSQTPNDPKHPIIAEFRAKYGCPPYSKKRAGRLAQPTDYQTVTTPGPTVTVTAPEPTATVTAHPAARTVTATTTRMVTRTKTVAPSCPVAIDGKCLLGPLHSGP